MWECVLRKVLENVPTLGWGKNIECTFFGALDATLRFLGEPVDYVDLMGFSAAAFRLRFHQPEWCASSPDAALDERHSNAALKAVGYRGEFVMWMSSKQDAAHGMFEIIKEEIDEGTPILALGLLKNPDWGIVTGYENDKIICRTYYDKGDEYSVSEEIPLVLFRIGEKGEKPERLESILNSLKLAVELAYIEEIDDYANGLAAYEAWIEDLENEEMFANMKREDFVAHWLINAWVYNSLYDARLAASKYLHRVARNFTGKKKQIAENAAERFEKITRFLLKNWVHFTMPRSTKKSENWASKGKVFSDDWTREMRRNGAKALGTVKSLEEEAFEVLRRVIKGC